MGEPSAFHGLAIMHVSRRLPACHATASARRACRRARAPCSDPTPPVQNGRLCAHSATVEARRECTSAGNWDATVPQCAKLKAERRAAPANVGSRQRIHGRIAPALST